MIVVTGMHRSGTSLACQLLSALGVSFGVEGDEFERDAWNTEGYFERKAVMDVNSRLVTGWSRNRSRWTSLMSKLVYLTMPPARRIAERAPGLRETMRSLSVEHHDGALKDPRFCLTLGHWAACGDIEHVVVCLRHPASVVASLQRRNRLPSWLGHRFYRYHMQELLRQLPIERTVFVDMDRLAFDGDVSEVDLLRRVLGLDAALPLAALAKDVLRTQQFRRAPGERTMPPATAALWQRVNRLASERRLALEDQHPQAR